MIPQRVVIGDDLFEPCAVNPELVGRALEVEQFPHQRCVGGLDMSVQLG